MKGYVGKVSFDLAKGCSFKYFTTRAEAMAWVQAEVKKWQEETESEVAEIEVNKCGNEHCKNLVPADEGRYCLRCEDIMYDARCDKYAEEGEDE